MRKFLLLLFLIVVTSVFAQNYLLDFDGIDDYIAVPGADSINTAGPYENRTIEMWFKADTLKAWQTLYEEGGRIRGFHIYLKSDTLCAGAWNENETSWEGTWYKHNIFANKWYHVALVLKDGTDTISNNKLFAYINGYEFSTGNKQGTKVYKHGGDIHIARHAYTKCDTGDVEYTGDYFDGRLNEIRVWNVARTQQEIKDNMYNEISPTSHGLVAYWNLDDGSGTTATDVTGLSSDGTLTNMDPPTDWIESDLPPEPEVKELMFDEISDNKTGKPSTTGFIEVYNPSRTGTKDISGYKIIVGTNPTGTNFVADSPEVSYTFPSGTTLAGQGVITIGNGASRTDFNTAWGTSLSSSEYLVGSSSLVIASGKAYALDNGSKSVVDTSPEVNTDERRIVEENDLWGDPDTTDNGSPGNKDSEQDLPLPVVLSQFSATFMNGRAIIMWTTQSEENNNFWNVYRSVSKNFGQATKINSSPIPGANTTTDQTNYSYADTDELELNTSYYYWIESIDFSGASFTFGPVELNIQENNDNQQIPDITKKYGLNQNYPNPFNPTTSIKFALKNSGNAKLEVFNLKGRKVATLFNGNVEADKTIIRTWNAKDVSSGIYFFKLTTDEKTYIKKTLLLK